MFCSCKKIVQRLAKKFFRVKYVNTSTEEEAMLAETCARKEFKNPKACLLKQIKDELLDEIKIQDANS